MDITVVFSIFLFIIVEFLVELALLAAIVSVRFKRRSHFVIRLIISMLALFAIGFGLSFFYAAFGMTVWGRVIVYFALFLACIGASYFMFDEKIVPIIFVLGIAYALQNIMYKAWLLFCVTFEALRWTDYWGDAFWHIYRILSYSFDAIFIFVTWLCFRNYFRKNIKDMIFNKKILTVTALCLLAAVVLCSFQDVYFSRLSSMRENRFDDVNIVYLRHSSNLLSILASVLVLFLAMKSIAENHLAREVEYLHYTIKQSRQQYEISKDTIEMINIKCHDIKYQINSLAKSGDIKEEDLKKLAKSVQIYDSKFETGNQLLNVLLWEKSSYCEQNNITFSCMIDGENFDFMDPGDLYCLFGNLIDNAFEAVVQIEEIDKRVINLSVKRKANIILIEEDNYFNGTLGFVDGFPVTTKDDKNYHGFGMRSLRMIARKYGGELTASASDGIFHLSIIIVAAPAKEVKN